MGKSNEVGRSLDCFQKYQSGEWECRGCNEIVVDPDKMHELYRTSLQWAEECTASMTL